jgi:Dihydroorotate dehydrogenase
MLDFQFPSPRSTDTLASPSLPPSTSPQNHHNNRKSIFGSGGIQNGAPVLEMLQARADVAQIYTALVSLLGRKHHNEYQERDD